MNVTEVKKQLKKRADTFQEALKKEKKNPANALYSGWWSGLTEALQLLCSHPEAKRDSMDTPDGMITFEHCNECGKTW